MQKDRKITLIMGAITLAVIFASSAIAGKYEEYAEYAEWGVLIYAALLFVVSAVFLIRKENAA